MDDFRIGLDIDGVLANFIEPVLQLGMELGIGDGWPVDHTGVKAWMFHPEFDKVWVKCRDDADFWMNIQPYPDAKDFDFTPACYVTARPCSNELSTRWLARWGFPAAPVFTVTDTIKSETVLAAGANAFIDDRVDNYLELRAAGIPCLLYDRPWNQDVDAEFVRIKTLMEALPTLRSMND